MWGTRGTGATEQGTTIDAGGFDIVWETPTVLVPTSPVTEADYLRSASGSVVAPVVEAMEAGDVDTLLSLVTWNQVTCAPDGNRGVPSCSVLGLPPETTIQTLANTYLPGAGVPEAEVRAQFASYLGAEPQLIAAARVADSGPFDNAPATMLEFAIDPRRLRRCGRRSCGQRRIGIDRRFNCLIPHVSSRGLFAHRQHPGLGAIRRLEVRDGLREPRCTVARGCFP